MKPESVILRNLWENGDYSSKVLPFLKDEYFSDSPDLILFRIIRDYTYLYSQQPTADVLQLEIPKVVGFTDEIIKSSYELVSKLSEIPINSNTPWLVDYTEKFCQERALYNAIHESIGILEGSVKGKEKTALPEILREALGVSFDTHVGLDLLNDYEEFYEYLHDNTIKIPFSIEKFNFITNGGLPPKTLSLISGGTNVGKTLCMCSFAADHLAMGYDVLYITMEMSEGEIAKRIYANTLDVGLEGLPRVERADFKGRVEALRRKTMGKLIIKEYPNGTPTAATFRSLLSDLSLKKQFRPQIIYIDYLNIMASSRISRKNGAAKHELVQTIAEEVRALAQMENLPIMSATQLNRGGFGDSNPDLDDTADSFGLTMPIDFMAILISNEELEKLGQYVVKQAKNRFGPKYKHRTFIVGVDYDKQRIHDVDMAAYENVGMKDVTPDHAPEDLAKSKFVEMKKKASLQGFIV